ncbi:hypothetical protein AWB67_05386 [Caballeronia terrestris]|uniref:Uncharacterized protein n=1 Tax=Caballeronia terrestris TaxID=1226301 RepID=A0A158KDA3_9BURK|nr:hypothetical protein AWB67_05386 [Caballeronia terrestris]
MDFQYTRRGGKGFTYDVSISLRSEGLKAMLKKVNASGWQAVYIE